MRREAERTEDSDPTLDIVNLQSMIEHLDGDDLPGLVDILGKDATFDGEELIFDLS